VHGAWAREAIRIVVTSYNIVVHDETKTPKAIKHNYKWAEIFMGHNLGFLFKGHLSHFGSLVLPINFFPCYGFRKVCTF
jgi:hypothetical protein